MGMMQRIMVFVPISVNNFVIRATALALKEGPEANGNLDVHTTPLL
jgi:pyruvate/2-oxoglutarate dehydrogenase complex dihydrolipoamide acyltransferase (E2) component